MIGSWSEKKGETQRTDKLIVLKVFSVRDRRVKIKSKIKQSFPKKFL